MPVVFARLFARSAGSLDPVAASTAAAPAAAAFLGRANIAARQFIVYESVASHAARPREQPHLLGTLATISAPWPYFVRRDASASFQADPNGYQSSGDGLNAGLSEINDDYGGPGQFGDLC